MGYVTLAISFTDGAGLAGTLLGVLATLFCGWLGWRVAVPKRRATYSVEITPLLASTVGGLTVSLSAQQLEHPHIATLAVRNIGNREIEVAAFNSLPIEFDLNARVVSKLTAHSSDNWRFPPASIHGNAVLIQPHVVHKGQSIMYKVLLDGEDPKVTLRHSLSGTVFRQHVDRIWNSESANPRVLMILSSWTSGLVTCTVLFWIGWVSPMIGSGPSPLFPSRPTETVTATVTTPGGEQTRPRSPSPSRARTPKPTVSGP